MKLLYRTIAFIIYPLLIILIFFRKIINKEDKVRYKEKIFPSSFNVKRNSRSKLILFHAASIGELNSILPIIEELEKTNDNFEFLVTTLTTSSANLAKIELKKFKNAKHRFLPLDVYFLMKKFLSLWKPDAIFLVDSEIWPNLIFLANQNKIPLGIINARITRKTYDKWNHFPKVAKSIFSLFDLCIVSNQETKEFLERFDAKNIFYFGNLKFCLKLNKTHPIDNNSKFLNLNKFWLAASTHEGEDEFCLKAHIELRKKIKNIRTIIVPRHISRVKRIKQIVESFNLTCQILSLNEEILKNKEIIIVNSFGKLQNFYKYSKSVFIGKSTIKKLENVGGQNPIEASRLACKIFHGPYVRNFTEIYTYLKSMNVTNEIRTSEELCLSLVEELKGKKVKNQEILNKIENYGQNTLNNVVEELKNYI